MNTATSTEATFSAWPALQLAASDAGLVPADLLTLTAAILGGLSGPESGFIGGLVADRAIRPNLLVPGSDLLLGQQLQTMLSQARTLQGRLRHRPTELRLEHLEEARFGDTRKSKQCKNSDFPGLADLTTISIETHRHALRLNPHVPVTEAGAKLAPEDDLKYSASALRETALRHPTLLIENPDLGRLLEFLPSTHLGKVLVTGRLAPLLHRSARQSAVPDFQTIIDGCDIKLPPSPGLTSLVEHVHAQAAAVLSAEPDDVSQLIRRHRSLANSFILLGHGLRGDAAAVTMNHSEQPLIARVFGAIGRIIDIRRKSGGEVHRIQDQGKAMLYEHQRRRFLRRLGEQSQPVNGLASLPAAISWTICALHPDLDPAVVDDRILASAVPCAEIILERHLAALAEIEKASGKAPTHDLERRIVDRIRRRGAMRDRELRRSFSMQRAEVHDPAIEQLLDHEVLIRDDQGRLDRGPRFENYDRASTGCVLA